MPDLDQKGLLRKDVSAVVYTSAWGDEAGGLGSVFAPLMVCPSSVGCSLSPVLTCLSFQDHVLPFPLNGPFLVLPAGAKDLLVVAPFSSSLIESLKRLGWETSWLRPGMRSSVLGLLDRVMISFPLASFPQATNWSPGGDVAAFRQWYHASTLSLGWCHSMPRLERVTGPDGVTEWPPALCVLWLA